MHRIEELSTVFSGQFVTLPQYVKDTDHGQPTDVISKFSIFSEDIQAQDQSRFVIRRNHLHNCQRITEFEVIGISFDAGLEVSQTIHTRCFFSEFQPI